MKNSVNGMHISATIKNPKAKAFFEKAQAHIAKKPLNQDGERVVATIKLGQPEFAAWEVYFRRQGFMPAVMEMARMDRNREVTVPEQWPDWFDNSFVMPNDLGR